MKLHSFMATLLAASMCIGIFSACSNDDDNDKGADSKKVKCVEYSLTCTTDEKTASVMDFTVSLNTTESTKDITSSALSGSASGEIAVTPPCELTLTASSKKNEKYTPAEGETKTDLTFIIDYSMRIVYTDGTKGTQTKAGKMVLYMLNGIPFEKISDKNISAKIVINQNGDGYVFG